MAGVALGACAAFPGGSRAAQVAPGSAESALRQAAAVTITRDSFGVPLIDAPDEAGLAFGAAYAMAEDGFYALEETYAVALGRMAGWSGASALPGDLMRRALDAEDNARAIAGAADPAEKAVLQSFADGLNHYMRLNPARPPRHIARYEPWMVVAVAQDAAVMQPLLDAIVGADDAQPVVWSLARDTPRPSALMLVSSATANPYEMTLRTPDGWSVHGVGALGVPVPHDGFNKSVSFADVHQDVRALLVGLIFDNPADSLSYRVVSNSNGASGDVIRGRATQRMDSVRVNTPNGVVIQTVRTLLTQPGPVVGARGDTMIVFTGHDVVRGDILQRWRALSHATDVAAVRQAALIAPGVRIVAAVDASGGMVHIGADSVVRLSAGSAGWARDRVRAARALLGTDSVWSVDALTRVVFDTQLYAADDTIAALVSEWEQVGASNPERALLLDSAVSMLRTWDRRVTVGSASATLYAALADQLTIMESTAYPRFRALEIVVNDRRRFPPRAWGSVNAVARNGSPAGTPGIPTAGAPARHGGMFAYDAKARGQRYAWVVELGGGLFAASSVLSYGVQSDPDKPHWFDQAPLFAAGRMKVVPGDGAVPGGTPYHPGGSR